MEPNIKKIWGIAKSPELKLTDEELHLVVQAHTGKDSIKALNKRELQTVIRVLGSMKDSAKSRSVAGAALAETRLQRTKGRRYSSSHRSLDGTSPQGSTVCAGRCSGSELWNG